MTRARKHLVCLSETPYYHVSSRCVRRAFLCGVDKHTGQSFEHRRSWIENRAYVLASLFSIELCAYAIMSNHYHLVVKLLPDEAAGWSDDNVLDRWTALFKGPVLVQRYRAGESLTKVEQDTLNSMTAVFRKRLASLSWFMKCLNEPIARRANAEDGCSGHFWEARFHSQPLRSWKALVAAMAYVDLNPIRAGLARTPESSPYTSIRARIRCEHRTTPPLAAVSRLLDSGQLNHWNVEIRPLMQFAGNRYATDSPLRGHLPMYEAEYLKLVDTTGRLVVRGKSGHIDADLRPVFERLGLAPDQWLQASSAFADNFRNGDLRLKQTA